MLLTLLAWGSAGVAISLNTAVVAAQTGSSSNKSWTESISSGFKKGVDKVTGTFSSKPSTPVPNREDDAVSLKTKGKPGPDLYVALARVYEQRGKTVEAEQQYQLALNDKEKPDDLAALLGYAQLQESVGKPNEAIQLYQRAAKAHPQESSVYNNLGLCYARQNRPDDAVAAMSRAIQLAPKNALYRNNIATVLVDQGKPREALEHLRKVHDEAAAYYNMGYLLNKKGQAQAAFQHFEMAAKADPSMESAKLWVAYLQKTAAQARLSQHPIGVGVKTASQPMSPKETLQMLPDEPKPRRLPPTVLRQPSLDGPSLPGISYDRSAAPAAPMPPATSSAVRPLPRVN